MFARHLKRNKINVSGCFQMECENCAAMETAKLSKKVLAVKEGFLDQVLEETGTELHAYAKQFFNVKWQFTLFQGLKESMASD